MISKDNLYKKIYKIPLMLMMMQKNGSSFMLVILIEQAKLNSSSNSKIEKPDLN